VEVVMAILGMNLGRSRNAQKLLISAGNRLAGIKVAKRNIFVNPE
jgi:hypothetical protein